MAEALVSSSSAVTVPTLAWDTRTCPKNCYPLMEQRRGRLPLGTHFWRMHRGPQVTACSVLLHPCKKRALKACFQERKEKGLGGRQGGEAGQD